eukprot:6172573-Pleurochrysis_carterae.AAC.1
MPSVAAIVDVAVIVILTSEATELTANQSAACHVNGPTPSATHNQPSRALHKVAGSAPRAMPANESTNVATSKFPQLEPVC